MASVNHPIFARTYLRVSAKCEARGGTERRIETLAGIKGRVVEIGAGNGLNFRHYPTDVTEVVAIEPEKTLREAAETAARDAPVPVTVIDGVADPLPHDDASFDAGVASLVLCTVPDPDAALSELHRVIRPGGELRFLEHVASEEPGFRRFQRAAQVVWPHFAGGCNLLRDTEASIMRAGFSIESARKFDFRPVLLMKPVGPFVLGTARRP